MLSLFPISHIRFQSRSHSSKSMINPAALDLPTTEFPRIVGAFAYGPTKITFQGYYETKSEFRVNFWNLDEPDHRKRPLGNIILKAHKAPDDDLVLPLPAPLKIRDFRIMAREVQAMFARTGIREIFQPEQVQPRLALSSEKPNRSRSATDSMFIHSIYRRRPRPSGTEVIPQSSVQIQMDRRIEKQQDEQRTSISPWPASRTVPSAE